MTAQEIVAELLEDTVDENWRKWATGAALGAALIGGGVASRHAASAPKAAQSHYVDPDAEREAKAEQRLRNKADQLRSAGQTSGIFQQGKLQQPAGPGTMGAPNTAERRVSRTDF